MRGLLGPDLTAGTWPRGERPFRPEGDRVSARPRAEPRRSRGDDGRDDPGDGPEPKGDHPEGRSADRDAHPPGPRATAASPPTAEGSGRPAGAAGTGSGLTPRPRSERLVHVFLHRGALPAPGVFVARSAPAWSPQPRSAGGMDRDETQDRAAAMPEHLAALLDASPAVLYSFRAGGDHAP